MQYPSAGAHASTYPDSTGYRRNAPETSREAAEAIAPMARNHPGPDAGRKSVGIPRAVAPTRSLTRSA